ncbi:MAG: universal stress protein [Steroidobacteraceae bacterium]
MHVLCATDLTPRSEAALRRAAALASRAGGSLTLLHVAGSLAASRKPNPKLTAVADSLTGPGAPRIDVLLRHGNVLDTIAHTAVTRAADLIVVAAPRARRLDAIVGTSAERLIRGAARPVLVVRGGVNGHYEQVTIAAGLNSSTAAMLNAAVRLAGLDGAYATLVHALQLPYDGMMRIASLDETAIEQYQRGFKDVARNKLWQLALEAGLQSGRSRVDVRIQPAAQAIRSVLEHDRPELLAIGANRWFLIKRLAMGSVADQVLRTAQCDVLVIPRRRAEPPPGDRGLRIPKASPNFAVESMLSVGA